MTANVVACLNTPSVRRLLSTHDAMTIAITALTL